MLKVGEELLSQASSLAPQPLVSLSMMAQLACSDTVSLERVLDRHPKSVSF